MFLGCFELFLDTKNRFKAFCKGVPVLNTEGNSFIKSLEELGADTFGSKIDEIIAGLEPDMLDYLKSSEDVSINFTVYNKRWYSTNIFDRTEKQIARVSEVIDLQKVLYFYKLPASQKKELLDNAIIQLGMRYRFDVEGFNRYLDIYIPASKNGLGPDYRTVPEVVYLNDPGTFANIKIKMTGSRKLDESAAFERAGIDAAEAEGYSWHHLDDFDPVTGECTMQLVLNEYHLNKVYGRSIDHIGGVGVWEYLFGVKYKS